MSSLSKKGQRLAEEAWYRYQTQARPAPLAPPESVLASGGYEAVEPLDVRRISIAEQTGESIGMALAYEKHLAAHAPSSPPSGSFEEEAVLAEIESLRADEQARDEAKKRGFRAKAHLVSGRIRDGRWVEVYRLARGRFVEVS